MLEAIFWLFADPLLHERLMFSVYMSAEFVLAAEAFLMTITLLAVDTIVLRSLVSILRGDSNFV